MDEAPDCEESSSIEESKNENNAIHLKSTDEQPLSGQAE